jgi:hypothetical protein
VSTIKVDSIQSSDGNTDLLTLSNGSVSGVNFGRRNLIINGAMQVAQRGTSFTGITSNGYHVCDRWSYNLDIGETITMSQESDAPSGLRYSTKILVTTPSTSIGSTDHCRIEQKIENQDVQHLAHGTSEAKQLTVSFWVKSNKTGSYSIGFYKDTLGVTSSQGYTVNSSGAWEYKTITFSPDTVSGIASSGSGLRLWFSLAAGADRISGTANTWSTSSNNRAVGQSVNLYDATNNYWQITGVQLEVGSVATPFEHRSYGEELALCQRYFQKSAPQSGGLKSNTAGLVYTRDGTASAVTRYVPVRFVQTMRTTPSVTIYDGALTEGTLTQDSTNGRTASVSLSGDQAMMVYGPSGISHYSTLFGYYLDAEL